MKILLLTNNLTGGAISHQFIDIGGVIGDEHEVYAGALLGGTDPTVVEELESEGCTVVRFSFGDEGSLSAGREFYRFLEDVDVLHTHLVRAGVFGRIFGRLANVPIIVSTEQKVHTEHNSKQRVMNGLTLPLADAVTTISDAVADSFSWWEDFLLEGSTKRKTVYNTVNPELVQSSRARPPTAYEEFTSTAEPLIGAVGRLIPVKNHEVLVEALPQIQENHPSAKLIIVGDGELKERLKSLSRELNVEDSVVITGWVERKQVYRILHSVDIYAMPSLAEGMGVALVEAMFAEKPIVVSDIPIFHEIAGEAALFAEDDATKWTEQISKLTNRPTLAEQKGTRARKRAARKFSPSAVAERYIELYEDCSGDGL